MLDKRRLLKSLHFFILTLGLISCGLFSIFEKNAPASPSQSPSSPTIASTTYSTPVQILDTATFEPSPTKAVPVVGDFKLVASLSLADQEGILDLLAESDGTLWLLTDLRVLQFRQGTWSDYLAQFSGTLMGMDSNHRVWVASDDLSQVSAWDGTAWTDYGPAAAWEPLSAYSAPQPGRWRFISDSLGQVWTSTDQDVRMFDGTRWTVFTLADMGMTGAENEDVLPETRIAFMNANQSIWVLSCYWMGPGPDGGGGARWYDGQTWHGSDTPAVFGCATSIAEDRQGNIWLGLDHDLWQLNTSSGSWNSLPAPQPPDDYRPGYITDLVLDPLGDIWPELMLCGGASCGTGYVRYHIHAGEWLQVGEVSLDGGTLHFDASGQGWLFRYDGLYRITDNRVEAFPDLQVLNMAEDDAGAIWVIALYQGETGLWMLAPGP